MPMKPLLQKLQVYLKALSSLDLILQQKPYLLLNSMPLPISMPRWRRHINKTAGLGVVATDTGRLLCLCLLKFCFKLVLYEYEQTLHWYDKPTSCSYWNEPSSAVISNDSSIISVLRCMIPNPRLIIN